MNASIFANSGTIGSDCATDGTSPLTDGGYNLADDGSCVEFTAPTSNFQEASPILDTSGLQDNAGPNGSPALTDTIALDSGATSPSTS